jgi:hypothetical protein
MNYHKNHENILTTKQLKGAYYPMNIVESLESFKEGYLERAMHKMLNCLRTRHSQDGWYKRFTGRSKNFKRNQRKGL